MKRYRATVCYISGMWWKHYSPGWSAQYSGSDPSGRRRKCRRGRSCSVSAAEIRDQTFRRSAWSCLLSTVARHSACCAECQTKRLEKLLTVFRSDLFPPRPRTGDNWHLLWDERGEIYTETDPMRKSWKVCNNSNGLNPRCQSYMWRTNSGTLLSWCHSLRPGTSKKRASKPPSFQ